MSEQAIIEALRDARLSGRKLGSYPGPTPATKAEAFAIQSKVKEGIGWIPAGWKTGCTSERAQQALKTDGPFPGPVYRERLYPSGTHLETHRSNSRVTEPEIAFTFGADLPACGRCYHVDDVLAAVASVHPAIEIVNPRLPKGFDDVVEWYIADGALNHALVLGEGVRPLPRDAYAAIRASASVNSRPLYSGIGANALGGPERVLTWLANDLIDKGLHLKAGDVVTTGVITEVFSCEIGDEVTAAYEGLGTVTIRF